MYSIFIGIQIILAFLYVAYLVHQYSLPEVPILIKLLVYLTWLLSFSIVVLLPYDIYYSMQQDYAMSIVWKSIYYAIFVLTWLLLPIAQQFQTAGQFTTKQKLKTAVINNLIIYGIFLLVGGLFLVYLLFKNQLTLQELSPILMAAANAFGMFLVVIFLSYGLVAIPKQLWRQRKYEIKLKQKQFTAATLSKKKENVLNQLELRVKQILHQQRKGQTVEINYIINLIPQKYKERWNRNIPDLGEVNVVKAHKEIKEYLLQIGRLESRWDELIRQAFLIEDVLANMNSPSQRIESTLFLSSKYDFLNYLHWEWYCQLKPHVHTILAVFFSLFALAIVVAQFSVFLPFLSFLNPFSHLMKIKAFLALDISLFIVMLYIVFCVNYALFKLKFSSYYGLYWNKQTDASSLMFFAINCSRVSTPLCYNFLQIINDKNTSFSKVMGSTDIVPVFGDSFYYIFPVLLILLILMNSFDVYSKLAKLFGLQKFQFQTEFNHQNIDQGKKLLQRARIDVQNKILNSTTKDLRDYRSYKSELGTGGTQLMSKESSSSDQIAAKGKYFNEFKHMDQIQKIMSM